MFRPKLLQAVPTNDFKVYLYYNNGEVKLYDCGWVLEEKGVFENIHDKFDFMELCTVMNHTLAFDISRKRDPYNCIDICPDTVYEDSVKSRDFLENLS